MRNIFFVLSVMCCCISCHKDSLDNESTCDELPQGPPFGWSYIVDTPHYSFPYFNPNNPEQIIFQKKNYQTGAVSLLKFNLVTKVSSVLYAGENIFQPKWGKDGWILLNLSDNNIWKIKDNGDHSCPKRFS
jgi:hypothetical protein